MLVNGRGYRLTLSLGVAGEDEEENPSRQSLINEADRCLQQAKGLGRNRTIGKES